MMIDFEEYLTCLVDSNMSVLTINDYRYTFKRFFSRFDLLNEKNVKVFIDGFRPSTKSKYRKQLKGLADYHNIKIDWKRKVPQPKQFDEAPLTITDQHARRLIDYIEGRNRLFAKLLMFMLETGLRISELESLTPESYKQLTGPNGKINHVLLITKIGTQSHSQQGRYVPLTVTARHIIEEFGLPFSFERRRLNDMLVAAREALKLPHYKIHSMRKTFMSRALKRGVDVVTLANVMGHRDLKTMLAYADREAETVCEAFLKVA